MADLYAGVDNTEHYEWNMQTNEVLLVIHGPDGRIIRKEPVPNAVAQQVRERIKLAEETAKPKL
jgi:hypothetical protein